MHVLAQNKRCTVDALRALSSLIPGAILEVGAMGSSALAYVAWLSDLEVGEVGVGLLLFKGS